jgi:hypothetical protein
MRAPGRGPHKPHNSHPVMKKMFRKALINLIIFMLALPALAVQERAPERQPQGTHDVRPVPPLERATPTSDFARLSEKLSERGGDFHSDNLISNETSYQHVLGKMRSMNVTGGAYIGVGPDQNFTYIAQIRPHIAYLIDIRRDNLLQHLMFKALFALARNRVEYLCLLFGRPVPPETVVWKKKGIEELVQYIDQTSGERKVFEAARARIQAKVQSFGVPLSEADLQTIGRIHENFFYAGLNLRYSSRYQSPRPFFPTYRELLLERDLTGRRCNYLAHEEDFQFLKEMQRRHLIIPVVGNLAGEHALAAIGQDISARGERVSAFYTSNVEFYLMRAGTFDTFAQNVKLLPRDNRSVIIRSYFSVDNQFPHAHAVPGYYCTQLLQTIDSFDKEFTTGGYRTYSDLVNKHLLDL